jgi:hypothetical protein
VCAALIAVPGAAALAQDTGTSPAPTIQSDKADYAPGELVTLTGSGWQAGESVNIVVNDNVGQTWNRNVNVIADPSGNITDSFNLPDWFVATYTVTATGASGTATTSFTDGNVRVQLSGVSSASISWETFSNTTCNGTPSIIGSNPSASGTVNADDTSLTTAAGVDPGQSIKLVAPTITGKTFANWTRGSEVRTTSTICVVGSNGTQNWIATYTTPSDTTAPTVSSINRANANPTNASSVGWNVTFSESVTGVDAGDFQLANTGLTGPGSINVTGSGANYSVTANTGTGSGTLGLNLNDNDSIADAAGNKLGGTGTGTAGGGGVGNGSFTGEVYTIDRTAANVTLTDVNGAARTFPYLTNQDVASLGGSCEPGGSPVSVTLGGNPTSPPLAPCSPSGSWTLNLITPVSTDGVHNFAASQVDAAGNPGSSGNKPVQIDKTAPNVQCGSADGNWHADNVSIACTAIDGGSDLANPGDASFNLTTNVADGEENNNASTNSRNVADAAGNSATAGPISGNKVDRKAPSFNCDSADGNWHADNVSIACTAIDGGSGLNPASDTNFSLSTTVAAGNETNNASTGTKSLTDDVGNSATAGPISGNKVDRKAPVLTNDGPTPTNPNGANNWYITAVTNKFTATDGGSGFGTNGDPTKSITNSSGTNEGSAVKIASGAVSDALGNSAASIDSAAFKIDLSDPYNVQFSGGPAAGGTYDFGNNVPAAPTCTASDDVSGMPANGCVVTGYSNAVGSHTMTATATDNAGRKKTATRTYTVKAANAYGFYQPVDMGGILNTVKSGSTVPVKFELIGGASNIEQKSTSAVGSMSASKVSCAEFNGDPMDAIEYLAPTSENTGLRFDTTGDQFIYNWKTPAKAANTCYNLTMTAADNTTKLVAYFKLT